MKFSRHSWAIFLVYWFFLIFFFSSQEYVALSGEVHKISLSTLIYEWKEIVAHFGLFFTLSILLIINLRLWTKFKTKKIILLTLIICFLYAISDEFHQLFVKGRSSSLFDIVCDFLGAITGAIITLGTARK